MTRWFLSALVVGFVILFQPWCNMMLEDTAWHLLGHSECRHPGLTPAAEEAHR